MNEYQVDEPEGTINLKIKHKSPKKKVRSKSKEQRSSSRKKHEKKKFRSQSPPKSGRKNKKQTNLAKLKVQYEFENM